ncbi:hypothetical protein GIY23_21300 [Allosaccharopolyspora coralli]|uniref:DUF2269 domain-containing protein n=1 Tax=Allosaccharopolyspora coralli TaxID=2665642 RepID=A0A5Q3QBF9_9PSEU|nr:hypothetical protein [Allosaccharopolyspora coralli]QGK71713.1 hypothetical protein GIY23_21300 [Allosaccharopolyspora coralli]
MATTVPAPEAPLASGSRPRTFLPPRLRKILVSLHVVASVSWIGGSVCLLALGLTGVLSGEPQLQRAAYIALGILGSQVLVPVTWATLFSGILVSLGTKWGLFRYWWTMVSLVATVVMTLAVNYALAPTLVAAGDAAARAELGTPVLDAVGSAAGSAIAAPIVASVALSFVTWVNVAKPWGRIRT